MHHDTNNQKWLPYPIMINQVCMGLLTDGLKTNNYGNQNVWITSQIFHKNFLGHDFFQQGLLFLNGLPFKIFMFINEGGPTRKKIKMLKQIPIIHDFFSNANPLKSMIPTVLGLTLSKCRWVSGP